MPEVESASDPTSRSSFDTSHLQFTFQKYAWWYDGPQLLWPMKIDYIALFKKPQRTCTTGRLHNHTAHHMIKTQCTAGVHKLQVPAHLGN